MSINFASGLQDTSKSSVRVSPENPTRGSVHGVSKLLPSIFQRSQERRSKSELNKSISGKKLHQLKYHRHSLQTARNHQVQKEANHDLHLYPLHLALEVKKEWQNEKSSFRS
ncbi:hypothetical protein OIU78_004137 [Salix suchowensis]|nr:hypothetical protein OIU78_004137 [Salix suchowensis]